MKPKTLHVISGNLVVTLDRGDVGRSDGNDARNEPIIIDGTAVAINEEAGSNSAQGNPRASQPASPEAPAAINPPNAQEKVVPQQAVWLDIVTVNSPLGRVGIPAYIDIREKLADFRSLEEERKERKARLARFTPGDRPQKRIKRRLHKCSDQLPCLLPACPVCHREWQIVVASQAAAVLAKAEKCTFVTLVAKRGLVRVGRLCAIDLDAIKKRLSKQLATVKLGDKLVFGGIEVTYACHFKRYIVHVHLLIADCSVRRARRLRQFYPSFRRRVRDPKLAKAARRGAKRIRGIVTEDADDLTRLSAYVIKGRIWQQNLYIDRNGGLKTQRKRRPSARIHTEMMQFLAEHREQDFLILQRIRSLSTGRLKVHYSVAGDRG